MARLQRFVPLTGALAVVLVIVGFVIAGEPPDGDASAREVVRYFTDNDDATQLGAALEAAGAIAMLFFAAYLSHAVQRSGDVHHRMTAAVLGGGIVAAAGFAIDASLRFAAADTAGDIDPVASQTINALWSSFFFPMVAGLVTLLLATAIASYHSRLLPRWLVWITFAIVVVSLTPLGFIGAIASALWIIVVGILLMRRESAPPHPSGPPPIAV